MQTMLSEDFPFQPVWSIANSSYWVLWATGHEIAFSYFKSRTLHIIIFANAGRFWFEAVLKNMAVYYYAGRVNQLKQRSIKFPASECRGLGIFCKSQNTIKTRLPRSIEIKIQQFPLCIYMYKHGQQNRLIDLEYH